MVCLLSLMIGQAVEAQSVESNLTLLPDLTVKPSAESSPSLPWVTTREVEFSRDELQTPGFTNFFSVAALLPGVTLNQIGHGSNANTTIRGSRAGVGMFMLDGVPLYGTLMAQFPMGKFPLDFFDELQYQNHFDPRSISGHSLGGSVHLQSRHLSPQKVFWHSEGGSYGTLRNHLGTGFHSPFGDVTMMVGRTDVFDGISQAVPDSGTHERDPFNMTHGLMRWDKTFEQGKLDASLYYVQSHEQMDGPGVLQPLSPSLTIGWLDDGRSFLNGETWVSQIHGLYRLNPLWDTELRIGFTRNRDQGQLGRLPTPDGGVRTLSMDMDSQLWLAHWENRHEFFLNADHTHLMRLSWGVDAQQQHGESPDQPEGITSLTRTMVSSFAQLDWLWEDWFLAAQWHYDHYDAYGGQSLFNLTAGRYLNDSVKVWLKGGSGFRQPSVNELLHPFLGLWDLKPERSKGGEIGAEWQLNAKTSFNVTGFYQRYSNMIVATQVTISTPFVVMNIPDVDAWGVELQFQHQWHEDWRSGLTYSYMNIENAQTGKQVPYRPEHNGQFWTTWQISDPLSFRVDLSYRGEQWIDNQNQNTLDGAPRLSANLNYQVNEHLSVYVRGENMNDDRTSNIYRFYYSGPSVYGGFFLDL